jgi:hypothetical protein
MNVGEYGKRIYVNCGEDISTATGVSIEMTKPDETVVELTAVIGASPVSADCGETFASNEHIYYTTINGDIDQEGTYYIRPIILINSKKLIGKQNSFEVGK